MSTVREIRLNAAVRTFELDWSDMNRGAIPFIVLREACMCAECRSARQKGRTLAVAEDIAVIGAVACGPNAVQLFFSDGHSRGIFPFNYLRELAAREATTPDEP